MAMRCMHGLTVSGFHMSCRGAMWCLLGAGSRDCMDIVEFVLSMPKAFTELSAWSGRCSQLPFQIDWNSGKNINCTQRIKNSCCRKDDLVSMQQHSPSSPANSTWSRGAMSLDLIVPISRALCKPRVSRASWLRAEKCCNML